MWEMDTHHPNTPKVRKRGKGEEERDAVCRCEDEENGNLELQIRGFFDGGVERRSGIFGEKGEGGLGALGEGGRLL